MLDIYKQAIDGSAVPEFHQKFEVWQIDKPEAVYMICDICKDMIDFKLDAESYRDYTFYVNSKPAPENYKGPVPK